MRKLAGLLIISLLALTACAPDNASYDNEDSTPTSLPSPTYEDPDLSQSIYVVKKALPDGRTVVCLWAVRYKEASIDCDWEHAK